MEKTSLLFVLAITAILGVGLLFRFFPGSITGFMAGGNNSVEVTGETRGRLSAVIFQSQIEYGEIENISVEFSNIGSLAFNERIEVGIYYNRDGKLEPIGVYYDSQYNLKPGMARGFSVYFLPPNIGTFYIKAKVTYAETSMTETWRAFLVTYTYPPQPPVIVTLPPSPPPAGGTITPPKTEEERGIPDIKIEYPNTVEAVQGQTAMFNILVKNTGQVSITNIKMVMSTSSLLGTDINPKQIFRLYKNDTAIFLVSIDVPETTPEGSYEFYFEILSDQIKSAKTTNIVVTSIRLPLAEEINNTILNYKYLISEIQSEIEVASLRDIDVSQPQSSLDKARTELGLAESYYLQGRLEDAKRTLAITKGYIGDAVFQLSNAGIVFQVPAFAPWALLGLAIGIGLIFIIIFTKRKKKEEKELKRPALLKATTEES